MQDYKTPPSKISYNDIQPNVKKDINDITCKLIDEKFASSQYQITRVGNHAHTGVDSPQLDPKNFLGFPITLTVPTTANNPASTGAIVIFTDSLTAPTLAHFYVRIGTTWKIIT
jgi:hypothetical protein